MLLVIDIGNTETVLGVYRGEDLIHTWRVVTASRRTADEYRLTLRALLDLEHLNGDLTGAALASVVPSATAALRLVLPDIVSGPVTIVETGIKTGIKVAVDNPREVGADRVVNAVAAAERYPLPVVVVDFGTSSNFDVIDMAGNYVGGVIAPGLAVSLEALIDRTAALRRVELVAPASVIGTNTVAAIQSGLVYGHAGFVDGIVERMRAELEGEITVVATGGLARTIAPHCSSVDEVDEHLTLFGLKLLHEMNT
ncbi:MAG: type III pantothenate kinase [Acidimicrobiia bacterium]|nr:type III pantothenate kinase [Acidimicrobiia bacterium]MBT8249009.1 type III pantothenate kinase [Acidimicrobiia bacterium]NNC42142.1 type III pantothenate kinase [Acidimicrobiia bacterium]NND13888.1 type III pantothenate kinase [Acidimicrobiia bacterium]NNL27181.1 type III pantothenate kinase [Acidimicrobiia bacterium]